MCVSACRERPLCTVFTFFFFVSSKFWLILCPSMVPKCRANLFKEDINTTVISNTDCCDSSFFSVFCLNVSSFVCLYLLHANPLCPVCFCAFTVSRCLACAWPQLHFTQLSHPIVSHTAAVPCPSSSVSGGQRRLEQGVTSAYRVRWPHCLGWVVSGASSFIHSDEINTVLCVCIGSQRGISMIKRPGLSQGPPLHRQM